MTASRAWRGTGHRPPPPPGVERFRNGSRPRGMQDLVAVGVPDAGHEGLVPQQVLEFARVSPDALPPQVEGQRRIIRIGAQLGLREAGHDPVQPGRSAGRPCPSGWGRGSAPRPGRSSAGSHAAPRVHVAASRGPLTLGPNRRMNAVLDGSGVPGAASCRRPVSIGFTAMASRSRSSSRNLPRRWIAVTVWPTSASSLGRRPAHGERPRGRDRRRSARPASAAWNASATTVRSGNSGTICRL